MMMKNMLLAVGFFGSLPVWSSGGWSSPLGSDLDNEILYFNAEDQSFMIDSTDLQSPDSSTTNRDEPLNQATEDLRSQAAESRIFDRDVHRRQRWPLLP